MSLSSLIQPQVQIPTAEPTAVFAAGEMDADYDDDDVVDPFLPGANDSAILLTTFRVYGTLFGLSFLAFCLLRKRYRHIYNVRLWIPELRCSLADQYDDNPNILSWVWQLLPGRVSDDQIRQDCGMDGLCLLRMFSFGMKLCGVGILNSIWLLPVYCTAPDAHATHHIIDSVARATVSNIPPESARLYAPILASYCVFGCTMYFILKEFEWFARHRHAFLSERTARNYAVYVSGLPDTLKTTSGDQALRDFFTSIFSKEAILDAQLHWHIPQLQRKVQQRELLMETLERRMTYKQVKKKKPPKWHGKSSNCIRREIRVLNEEIPVLIQNIEKKHLDSANRNKSTRGKLKQAITSQLKMIQGTKDGDPRDGAFVYFRKLTARSAALQMIHAGKAYAIDVAEAPDPEDLCHSNVGKTFKELQSGRLMSVAAVFALRVMWTVPTAFVASLGKLESLKDEVPFLERWIEKAPWIVPFAAILAPFVLISLNSALPTLLECITLLEFPLDEATKIARQFPKLASFMIVQTFFVSAVSGSVWSELNKLTKNSSRIIDLLATALPGQSTYFMQILLVKTFIGLSMELLRIVPVMKSVIRRCLSPNLTAEQLSKKVLFIRPLCDPLYLLHAEVASANVLYFMVFFVYSSTAPVVSWFLLLCFFLLYISWGHQICCNYPVKPDSGGRLWITFMSIVRVSTIVGQLTLWGILVLKRFPYAIGLMLPLLGTNILFNVFIQQQHTRVCAFLPSEDCARIDAQHAGASEDLSFLVDAFKQPAMMADEPFDLRKKIRHDVERPLDQSTKYESLEQSSEQPRQRRSIV